MSPSRLRHSHSPSITGAFVAFEKSPFNITGKVVQIKRRSYKEILLLIVLENRKQ